MAIIVNNGNKNMIIGVVGFINSGKDTIADYLTNFHGFRRESFASTLKDAVAQVFGWDRTLLEGRTKQAREWRERVDPWWAERLNMPTLTPRWILQYWGTEVCRAGFHDDIWIASLENKLRNSQDDVVISDCRFESEINITIVTYIDERLVENRIQLIKDGIINFSNYKIKLIFLPNTLIEHDRAIITNYHFVSSEHGFVFFNINGVINTNTKINIDGILCNSIYSMIIDKTKQIEKWSKDYSVKLIAG